MVKIIVIFLLAFVSCFQQNKAAVQDNSVAIVSNKDTCDVAFYDKNLKDLAMNFNAQTIDINKSFSDELKSFLSTSKVECIQSNDNYRFFICYILLKQCYLHKQEYHLSYNFRSMKTTGAGKFIISEYEKISQDHDEFLSSYSVLNYVKTDTVLLGNKDLKNLFEKTNKLFLKN